LVLNDWALETILGPLARPHEGLRHVEEICSREIPLSNLNGKIHIRRVQWAALRVFMYMKPEAFRRLALKRVDLRNGPGLLPDCL